MSSIVYTGKMSTKFRIKKLKPLVTSLIKYRAINTTWLALVKTKKTKRLSKSPENNSKTDTTSLDVGLESKCVPKSFHTTKLW